MSNRLTGKVAIITGAASGIGAATAERFCREDAAVLVIDRNGDGAAAVAQRLDPSGRRARAVQADVQDEAAARACVRAVLKAWGRLDILVNNAAVASGMDLEEFTPEEFDRVIGINLKGPLLFCKHAVPAMQSGGGAIVNVASISATCGIPGQPIYAPSKGGLLQMTRQMAVEYASRNIRVNAVSPGTIETPLLRPPNDDVEKHQRFLAWLRTQHPIGRFGQPDEVAAAILLPGLGRSLVHHRRQSGRGRRLCGAVGVGFARPGYWKASSTQRPSHCGCGAMFNKRAKVGAVSSRLTGAARV